MVLQPTPSANWPAVIHSLKFVPSASSQRRTRWCVPLMAGSWLSWAKMTPSAGKVASGMKRVLLAFLMNDQVLALVAPSRKRRDASWLGPTACMAVAALAKGEVEYSDAAIWLSASENSPVVLALRRPATPPSSFLSSFSYAASLAWSVTERWRRSLRNTKWLVRPDSQVAI